MFFSSITISERDLERTKEMFFGYLFLNRMRKRIDISFFS